MLSQWRKFRGWSVLEYFLKNPNVSVHTKELSRTLKISPRTANDYLRSYEEDGVLTSEAIGNVIAYKLNNDQFLVKGLKRTYFLMQMNELGIERFATENDILSLAVYGSFASGDYTQESDIDILIISPNKDVDLSLLKPLETVFGTEIDAQTYTLGEWRKICRENREFAEEVKSNYVLIYGVKL